MVFRIEVERVILDRFKLDGRVALVTGAARGLGQAFAVGLAEAGADVALLDRLDVDETRRKVEALGRCSHSITNDLSETTPESAAVALGEVKESLGRLDILVNNAGLIRRSPALDVMASDWEEIVRIDLTSIFYLSQAAAKMMVEAGQGGKIINLCSILSFQGGIKAAPYTAAKTGLAGLTKALANEWAGYGINVNAIAPGYMTTELTAEIRSDPVRSGPTMARIPAGRWGAPEDLQGVAVYLASDASDYVHGAIISVDGGWVGY